MNFDDLKNPELQEKLMGASTPEKLLAIAKEEGFELSDAELDGVSGGEFWCDEQACPTYGVVCLPHG